MDSICNNVNRNDKQINCGTAITCSADASNISSSGKNTLPHLSPSRDDIPTHHFRIPTTTSPLSIAAPDSMKKVEDDKGSNKEADNNVPNFLSRLSDIAASQLLELSQRVKKDCRDEPAPRLEHIPSKPSMNPSDPTARIEHMKGDLPKRKASKSAVSCKKGNMSPNKKATHTKVGPSTCPPSSGGKQKEKRQRTKPRKDRSNLRKGKWTVEEEEFTSRIIHHFRAGFLTLPEGMTLRSYLASKLNCDPMRITKKFAGASCLGKRIYHLRERSQITINDIEMARVELAQLEQRFRLRVEHGQSGLPLPPLVNGSIIHSGQSLLNGVMPAVQPSTFATPLGAPNLSAVGLNPLLLQAMACQQQQQHQLHLQQQQQQNSIPWLAMQTAMQTPLNLALLTNLLLSAQQSQALAAVSPEKFTNHDLGLCQLQTTAASSPQVAPNANIKPQQLQPIHKVAVDSILPPSGILQNNIGNQLQAMHNSSSTIGSSVLPVSGTLHNEIEQKNTKLMEAISCESQGVKCAVPSKDTTINKRVDDQLPCKQPVFNIQKNVGKEHTQEDEDAGRTLLEFLRELQQNHSKAVSEDRSQRGSLIDSATTSSNKNLVPSPHLKARSTKSFVDKLSRRKKRFKTSPHHNDASVVTASINDSVISRESVSPMKTPGNAFIHQGREVAVQYFETSSSLGTSLCKTSDISRGGTEESSSYSESNMEQNCSEESDSSKSHIGSSEDTVDKESSTKGPVRKRFKRSAFTSRNVEDHNNRMDALRKDDAYSKRFQSQAKVADP